MRTLEIKSSVESMNLVEALVDQVCSDLLVNEDIYGNILIAVTEATNNAIIHGNGKDSSKAVRLYVDKDADGLVFSIEDQGDGFDFSKLPDPTAPENLEKPDGRGIFLMRNLADKIEFLNNGSKVNITFALNG
ncbi:MAG: ATP-binding protein [Putridiphycobacter sp.]|nr:ATP-binding protein [Putridiphycobacter sp.]